MSVVTNEAPEAHPMPHASRLAGQTFSSAAVEALIDELERRLLRLNSAARQEASGATDDLNAFVDEALADIAARLRDGTQSLTNSVTDQVSRMGVDMLKKLDAQMHRHPMAALALAAGLGFLVGVAGDRAADGQTRSRRLALRSKNSA